MVLLSSLYKIHSIFIKPSHRKFPFFPSCCVLINRRWPEKLEPQWASLGEARAVRQRWKGFRLWRPGERRTKVGLGVSTVRELKESA